jgi:flagellar biogenesis protein FliO
VAANKKKIVAFLVAIALGSGTLVVCSVQSAPAGQTKPLFNNSSSPFENDPNFSAAPSNSLGTRELFFKMMFSVLLVVALGAAVIYISKKFLPKITNSPGKEIHIIETAHLGPRKAVHLLKIGNQRLLIASTSESITKLADVTYASSEMDLSAQETDNNLRI